MLVWDVLCFIGAGLGTLLLLGTLSAGASAPQEAAGAAMALGFAVIPYCVSATVHRRVATRRGSE